MNYNKVDICGINTHGLKVLSEKENNELLRKAHEGDLSARDKLIKGNMKLVLSVVKRFSCRNENPDDLFQVGCIGLIKAIDNFNISYNLKLSTYAVPMIIGEIKRFLRDNNSVRVSRSLRDIAYKAMQIKESMINDNKKEPTCEEIAEKMGLKKQEVVLALEAVVEPVSLYEPVYTESGDTVYVMDQIGDNNTDENWIDEIFMKMAIDNLSSREKYILHMRFIRGMTQTEVAKETGISQAQVSRLEKVAIEKIKEK